MLVVEYIYVQYLYSKICQPCNFSRFYYPIKPCFFSMLAKLDIEEGKLKINYFQRRGYWGKGLIPSLHPNLIINFIRELLFYSNWIQINDYFTDHELAFLLHKAKIILNLFVKLLPSLMNYSGDMRRRIEVIVFVSFCEISFEYPFSLLARILLFKFLNIISMGASSGAYPGRNTMFIPHSFRNLETYFHLWLGQLSSTSKTSDSFTSTLFDMKLIKFSI